MKSKAASIFITAVLFTALFYKAQSGLNHVLFTLILVVGSIYLNRNLVKNKIGLALIAGAILSTIPVLIYGNSLSVISNWIALSVLSVYAVYPALSVISALVFSHATLVAFPVFMLIDFAFGRKPEVKPMNKSWAKAIALTVFPIGITIFFVFLYAGANASFAYWVKQVNIDFISPQLITTFIIGGVIAFAFFKPRVIDRAYDLENNANNQLVFSEYQPVNLFNTTWSLKDEIKSGIIIFILLNTLLLLVNSIDVYYLFISKTLPEGMSYSQFVHQGIDQLIFSILVAITIILFYFRSTSNFTKEASLLKILALIWVVQNCLMVFANIYKNQLYVEEFTLTYKRIGVYFYLGLTIAGLLLTAYKVQKKRSNFFLYRATGLLFFITLLFASFMNWDTLITRYNIYHSKSIDKNYLVSLSDTNIPDLLRLREMQINKKTVIIHESRSSFDSYSEDPDYTNAYSFDQQLRDKINSFVNDYENSGWRSLTIMDYLTYNKIQSLKQQGRLDFMSN